MIFNFNKNKLKPDSLGVIALNLEKNLGTIPSDYNFLRNLVSLAKKRIVVIQKPNYKEKIHILNTIQNIINDKFKVCKFSISFNNCLKEKIGNCIDFSIIFCTIGDELELPFHFVTSHIDDMSHIFIRWDENNIHDSANPCNTNIIDAINWETTIGESVSNESYINKDKIPLSKLSIKEGYYLRTLSKVEAVGFLHQRKGLIYGSKENYKEALNCLNQSLKLNPKCPMAYYNRGISNEYLDNNLAANQDFNKAFSMNPNDINALIRRGVTFGKLQNIECAIKDFESVLQLCPNNESALSNLKYAKKLQNA